MLTRRELLASALFSPAAGKWSLARRGERSAFQSPEGKRTFLLGVNHAAQAAAVMKPAAIRQTILDLGYNSAGYGAPEPSDGKTPWFAALDMVANSHYLAPDKFQYADVFDSTFKQTLRNKIRALCDRHKNDPSLVGYYWTDTPRWDPEIARRTRGTNWLEYYRALPTDAPGRQLLAKLDFAPNASLQAIAREIFQLSAGEFRAADPGRLLLGERYKLYDHPTPVLEEAAKYTDAVAIQPGPATGPKPGQGNDETTFDRAAFDNVHRVTKKPVIICDHACSFYTGEYPVTLWNQFPSREEATAAMTAYARAAMERPYLLSYSRCQFIGRFDPARQLLKQGLLLPDGRRDEALCKLTQQSNAALLKRFSELWMR